MCVLRCSMDAQRDKANRFWLQRIPSDAHRVSRKPPNAPIPPGRTGQGSVQPTQGAFHRRRKLNFFDPSLVRKRCSAARTLVRALRIMRRGEAQADAGLLDPRLN
jgi:hypothetical protein